MMASNPNPISQLLGRLRSNNSYLREFLAEVLGTFVLIAFGDASVAQVSTSSGLGNPAGDFFAINWGWGVGVALAVIVAGGASGAHLNPAVTLALTVVGKFPMHKIFHYFLAQYLGAFLGSSLVFGVYSEAINACEAVVNGTCGGHRSVPGTAGIFSTYPADHLSNGGGFADQVVGTALLLICVCAINDCRNMKISPQLAPLYVGFTVLNIGICFGFNCGYAINPARDLGPRIFSAMAGWGAEVFTYSNYWFYIPILGPHIGGILGAIVYTLFIENHWDQPEITHLPRATTQAK